MFGDYGVYRLQNLLLLPLNLFTSRCMIGWIAIVVCSGMDF